MFPKMCHDTTSSCTLFVLDLLRCALRHLSHHKGLHHLGHHVGLCHMGHHMGSHDMGLHHMISFSLT